MFLGHVERARSMCHRLQKGSAGKYSNTCKFSDCEVYKVYRVYRV